MMHRDVLIDCWPFLGGIAVSLFVAWLLVVVHGGKFSWRRLARLHADQRGAVQSLSFALTLPVFVMLMLFIVQLSQLVVGRLVVEYAAYAAARSAIVWIPADLGDDYETANRIGMRIARGTYEDENGHGYERYEISGQSRKLSRIHLAAALGLMSICPSRAVIASPSHAGIAAVPAVQRAYEAMSPGAFAANTRIPSRLYNKLAYALESTTVGIEIRHRFDEPTLESLESGPHGDEFAHNEIGWQDQVLVTVRHDFALLPGPGRFLARPVQGPGQSGQQAGGQQTGGAQSGQTGQPANQVGGNSPPSSDPVASRIRQRGSVYVYPMQATVRLSNEGEKSVLRYIQSWWLSGSFPVNQML